MLPNWTHTHIAGKPADVFEPSAKPRGVVLFLHPYGLESPATNAVYTAELAKHGLACCAPFGAHSWWVDRVCPEFDPVLTAERHLLHNVLPWMRARWDVPGNAVAAAGISMGGQGALRLGFRHPDRFRVVAGVASAVDFWERHGTGAELDAMYPPRERARQDSATLQVNPAHFPPHVWFACDPADEAWHRGNDRLAEKLTAFGLPFTADLDTSAGGHSWGYFDAVAPAMFAFVADGLAKERRRLV